MTGPPAETRSEALTRSRIEHWLRNRGLALTAGAEREYIGFGSSADAIMALIDDVLDDPTPPGQWLEGVHVDRRKAGA